MLIHYYTRNRLSTLVLISTTLIHNAKSFTIWKGREYNGTITHCELDSYFSESLLMHLRLFTYLIKTRIQFIKLGRKTEFDENVKERLRNIWVYVFGQKKLLKDKKSGIIHVMFFYGFILVQFGAIDLIWKGLKPGSHLTIWTSLRGFHIFPRNRRINDLSCGCLGIPPPLC